MKEAKVEEFINLKQGSMTVREYSLKFVKLSRYATSLMSNNRDEMTRFLTGIAEDLEGSVGQLCCMTTWTFPDLWSMSSKWRKAERGNKLW